MKLDQQDLLAGFMFLGVGLFTTFWSVANYRLGAAFGMGPGFFPAVLGALLATLGAVILAGSAIRRAPTRISISVRPLLFVILAILAYGILMRPLGILASTAVAVWIAAAARTNPRLGETALFGLVVAVLSWALFVKALGLPLPVWPSIFV